MSELKAASSPRSGSQHQNSRHVYAFEAGGKTTRFRKDRIIIGSVESADLCLASAVSPIHAVIEAQGSDVTIYDLKSDSGVFVNGEKVVTSRLKQGDRISIGSNEIIFRLEELPASDRKTPLEAWTEFATPMDEEEKRAILTEDLSRVAEIYDFHSTDQMAIEVTTAWCDVILNIQHFLAEKKVWMGTKQSAEIAVAAILSNEMIPLLTRKGEAWSLTIDSKMSGVIQGKGSLKTVEQLRDQSPTDRYGNVVSFNLHDFAKLTSGDLDFYIRFTVAPPRLKQRRGADRDPLFWKSLFGSLGFTTAFLLLFLSLTPTQKIEPEELSPRLATILYQPEKYGMREKITGHKEPEEFQQVPNPAPPKKKPVAVKLSNVPEKASPKNGEKVAEKAMRRRQEGQSEAKEGQGARAKGREGSRGSHNAHMKGEKQTQASRPSPQGGTGRGGSHSQVANQGNLDLLQGAGNKILSLLGSSSDQLGKGGKKLEGFGGFSTQGNGGLAMSGSGQGGGGNADSLGGLSDRGAGGGRVGTGQGAAGNGTGIIGGRTRVDVRTGGPEETVIMGSIDKEAVEAAIRERADEFQLCYDRELNAGQPRLAGTVTPTFVIGSTGRVTQAGVRSSSIRNSNVEQCVLRVLRRIQFPVPYGINSVTVNYPFKFAPTGN